MHCTCPKPLGTREAGVPSVHKVNNLGLQMTVKSELEKIFLNSSMGKTIFFSLYKNDQNCKFGNKNGGLCACFDFNNFFWDVHMYT